MTASDDQAVGDAVSAEAVSGTCRQCGAPVLLARSWRGSYVPVDAEPCPDGTVRVERGWLRPVAPDELLRERGRLYRPHARVCPDAAWLRERLAGGASPGPRVKLTRGPESCAEGA